MRRRDLRAVYEKELIQNELLLKGKREREKSYDSSGEMTMPFTGIVTVKRKEGLTVKDQELEFEHVEFVVLVDVKLEMPSR